MTDVFKHDPDHTSHDDLLARAFRDNAPQPTIPEEPGTDLSGLLTPTVGELDLDDRNRFRRVTRRTEIRSTDTEDITEVEYRKLRLEQVILVGVWTEGTAAEVDANMDELAALAETAGAEVLEALYQRRDKPDPGTYIGSGKVQELKEIILATDADTVIFDGELSPGQLVALETALNTKVIDRTMLILDIFAQHAKSKEGKAQVELAQLEYLLPRLRGWGESMSRQAGGRVAGGAGIGSRGPGEAKIELDRRRIRQRMSRLRRDIKGMESSRDTRRHNRQRRQVPSVVVVGYTNAGKSSLMNVLTDAGVLVENALFATLDPTVRRAETDDGREYTLTDTVGFVRNLPTQLVEAFRSTLEEAGDADVLLHVVDAAHDDPVGQINAVHDVLAGVEGTESIPELIVLSKADIADPVTVATLRSQYPNSVLVSAVSGEGIAELRERIEDLLPRPAVEIDLVIPYERGDIVNRIHNEGEILSQDHEAEGTRLHARVTPEIEGVLVEAGILEDTRGE